jgi:hypothetical protein
VHKLSDYQKRILLKNPNVEKVTEKTVIYKGSFRVSAVEKYLKGEIPSKIFEESGINPNFFIPKYCKYSINRWRRTYIEEGKEALLERKRGHFAPGRPKKEKPDELTLEELRALVEVQEEMIEMLKKSRALAKKKKVE